VGLFQRAGDSNARIS